MSRTDHPRPPRHRQEPLWMTPPLDRIEKLRLELSEPNHEYPELAVIVHDPDDPQHVWDCLNCSYDSMRADLDPPDIPRRLWEMPERAANHDHLAVTPYPRVDDDHELGYASEWLRHMTIEQVREELGADGFSVIWPNVTRR